MAQSSFSIDVNPAVLQWARKAAGQTTAYVAERLDIAEQTVRQWEAGNKMPPWQTLRKLAHCYQRPLAALLLPEPPSEAEVPPDFRTLPATRRELSSRTLLALRNARWLQHRAIEMRRELGMEGLFAAKRIRTSQNPETVAEGVRRKLGIELTEQTEWQNSNQAYRRWRESLEEEGILVFQFPFPVDEVRGFSLFDPISPVIVTNESDAINARIFTLFHEFAHLLLQKPGICLPQDVPIVGDDNIEPFCNRFAAALLIPREEALSWSISLGGSANATDGELQKLANQYRVSREVVLVRLRTIDRVSERTYSQVSNRWRTETQSRSTRSRKSGGGGASAAQICKRRRGTHFVSLVLEAEKRGVITTRDAITYLGVKLKDLKKLESTQ